MVRKILALLLLGLTLVTQARADEPKLDLSAWQHIPVLHGGRIMPLDTFARGAVDIICDRNNPTLSLSGINEEQLQSEEFVGARELFPAGKPRKFTSPELLLSWITEPERWEHVPFLIAEHDELRKDILGVPVLGPDGVHLKYVSPAQVAGSDKLRSRLEAMQDEQRAARMKGETVSLSGVDKKGKELFDALTLYRQITFNPQQQIQ